MKENICCPKGAVEYEFRANRNTEEVQKFHTRDELL